MPKKRSKKPVTKSAPRRTPEEVDMNIRRAAASDMLWTHPVLEVMKHFRLRHADVKSARAVAMKMRPKAVAALMDRKQSDARMRSALTVEQMHPGIHVRIVDDTETGELIGERYDLTRARVSQIKINLEMVAKDLSVGLSEAADRVEAAAQQLRG